MEQIIAEFRKDHPDIDVKIQVTPWDDYWTKLQTAATGGSAPDVFWTTLAYFDYYADGGALLPLDDQIEEAGLDMSNYIPAIDRGLQVRRHRRTACPRTSTRFGLFYNKTLFDDAGVELPDDSWTWEDVDRGGPGADRPGEGRVRHRRAGGRRDHLVPHRSAERRRGHQRGRHGVGLRHMPETIEGIQFWVDLVNKTRCRPTSSS